MSDSNETTALSAPKAASSKLSLGQRLAATDPQVLQDAVTDKLEKLQALAEDPSMPTALQQTIRDLAALASQSKPGMEEVQTSWKLPRLQIAQPTSQSDAKPESAKNGDLYTTAGALLERPYGIIPLYFFEENVNFPQQGRIPVCSAPDAKLGSPFGECLKCPHLPFGKQNGGRGDQNKTDCQNNIMCVALSSDYKQIVLIAFGKTSRKAGNALLSLAGQQTHVWKQSYVLSTEKKTADVGVYFVFKVEPTGKDNDANVMRLAETLYHMYNAERQRMLGDWYGRPARAPQAAVEAEGKFGGGALEQGLGGDADTGAEPDLSTPAVTPEKSKARTSNKPM